MMAARREEVREHQVAGYVGTLAAVARTLDLERARYDWLAEHVGEIPEGTADDVRRSAGVARFDDRLHAVGGPRRKPSTASSSRVGFLTPIVSLRWSTPRRGLPPPIVSSRTCADTRCGTPCLGFLLTSAPRCKDGSMPSCASWITCRTAGTVDRRCADGHPQQPSDLWLGRFDQMQELIARATPQVSGWTRSTEVVVRSEDIAGLVPRAQELQATWRPGMRSRSI